MSYWSDRRPWQNVLLLTVVALILSLAACGKAPVNSHDIIVIVPSATANEPAPELAADDRGMLQTAGATSTEADAYVVDPATGQPTEVPLTPRRADGQVEYGPRRNDLLTQNVNRVEQILQGQAAGGPFDLLGLIASAVRVASPPGTLLILSSGLSTAGGFDLRQVGWDANPASRRRATEGPRPAASPVGMAGRLLGPGGHRRKAACTAAATAYDPHQLLDGYLPRRRRDVVPGRRDDPSGPAFPQHGSRAGGPGADGQVRPGPHGSTSVSIPNDELFAFASASLLPGADSILGPLAAKAHSGHLAVTITGYAVPRRRVRRVQPGAVPGPRPDGTCAPDRSRTATQADHTSHRSRHGRRDVAGLRRRRPVRRGRLRAEAPRHRPALPVPSA